MVVRSREPEAIKILHILPWVTSGGVERRRMQLAQQLDPKVFEQRVLCLYAKYDFVDQIRDAGVDVVCLNGGRGTIFDVRTIARVVRYIREFQPHIVHGAVFEGVTLAALAGSLAKVPYIIVEETGNPSIRSWRGDLLMASLSRLADVAIGVSPPCAAYLRHQLHLGPRARLLMNGVDSPRLVSDADVRAFRTSLGIRASDFVVGSVGRIDDKTKRYRDLIDAIALMGGDVTLIIAGGGRDLQVLARYARQRGVDERVHLLGYRKDLAVVYQSLDVFALLSVQESFGLAIAEAMWCSRPVVATRVGGIPHLVEDGRSGLLVSPLAPAEAARALTRLRDDDRLREHFGERGRELARTQFSAERYVREVGDLYRHLVGTRTVST